MKKLIIVLSIMAIAFSSVAQTKLIQIAKGAKDVDSIYGATTKYYYVKTGGTFTTTPVGPLTDYYVYGVQCGTSRSATHTGSDSCHISYEVSLDNTTWSKLTLTATPTVTGGATYIVPADLVSTQAAGTTTSILSTYYPYVRIKFQHYVAATSMYPKAWVLLKKY